jgi:Flp pilus assembly protein TadG
MHMTTTLLRALRGTRQLWNDQAGLALTEFAYAAPLFAAIGLGGVEIANYSLAHLQVSQVASNLADVMSRTGEDSGLGLKQINESQINQALDAVSMQAESIDLTGRGRIWLSSLEQASDGSAWVRWQRCHGSRTAYTAEWGEQGDGKRKKDTFDGMGPTGAKISAPDNASAVMFVEVQYQYEPLIDLSNLGIGSDIIKSRAAYLVRDRRDLSNGNDPEQVAGVTPRKCNGSDPVSET